MRKITVSAPGKIHLAGEHAVVHGKPAVVVSTSKRMYVTLEKANSSQPTVHSLVKMRKKDSFINEIINKVEEKYKTQIDPDLQITVNSDIPQGAGMGSSAALAVSLVGALIQWLGKPWNATEINEVAFQAEKFQHINSSGSDPTIVTHGGILWYRKELDYLKTFWLLTFKIPKTFPSFVLINTGRSESAGELIAEVVGGLRKKDENAFILLVTYIEEVTRKMVAAIHDENQESFLEQIKENERFLEKMGVVSESTKKLIRDIEQIGGAAKISGAGGVKTGSGIVVAVHKEPKKLLDIAKKHNFPAFQTQFGGEGVKLEQVVV